MVTHIRRRPVLAGIVAVLLVVVLMFGGSAAWRLGWRLLGPPPPPRQTDVSQIADWMSVPYIGRAYRVPPPELYRALGMEPGERDRRRLREIAQETGRSSADTVQIVRETVLEWQSSHPERPRPSPPPDAPAPPAVVPPKPDEPGPDSTPAGTPKPAGFDVPPGLVAVAAPSPSPSPLRGRGEQARIFSPSPAPGGGGWGEGAPSAPGFPQVTVGG